MADFFADKDHLILFRPLADAGVTDATVLNYDTLADFLYLFDTDKRVEIWRAYDKKTGPVKAGYFQGLITAIVYNHIAGDVIAFTVADAPQRTGEILIEQRHLIALADGYRSEPASTDEIFDAIALGYQPRVLPDTFIMTADAFREYLADEKTKIHDLKRFFRQDD